jgi:hypothetical protein
MKRNCMDRTFRLFREPLVDRTKSIRFYITEPQKIGPSGWCMKKIVLTLVLFFIAKSAFAINLTNAKVRGNGCEIEVKIEKSQNTYVFPLNISLNKLNSAAFERKTCNLRLPIKLAANQKLIVSEALQNLEIKSAKGTKVKANLKIAIVGQKYKEMSLESESEENKQLIASGLVAESACGKDAMLTADISVFASGSQAARVKLGALSIDLKVVNCK